jgi:rRNA maturation endonuclease Nob1
MRTYSRKLSEDGKKRVSTWIQRRCIVCKRFLSKYQHKFCKKCADRKQDYLRNRDKRLKIQDNYYTKNRERINLDRRLRWASTHG